MAKSGRGKKHRDWRQTIFIIISILIVLSMALALIGTIALSPSS